MREASVCSVRGERKKSENEVTHYCTYSIILSSKPATVPCKFTRYCSSLLIIDEFTVIFTSKCVKMVKMGILHIYIQLSKS